MRIPDGTPENHPTPLPIDTSATPGVAPPTPAFSSGNEQGSVRDLAGERLSQLAASQADATAAMHAGMAADADRRGRYAGAMAPLGAAATDEMSLPPVPEQVTVPANGNLYGQGNQPGA